MALVSKSIPNLINGVSQQPAALRLESQGEVQENGFSDVVDGLKKRPPTKFLKQLKCISASSSVSTTALNSRADYVNLSGLDTAFFHTYKRSDDEQYHVIITSGKIVHVYDIAGNLRYQSGHGSWLANGTWIAHNTDSTSANAYLPAAPSDITSTSVADATFIVNKGKTVALSANRYPSSSLNQALVYLKSVNYGRNYTVKMTSKENTLSPDADHTTVKQITATATNNHEINSDGLKVSSVISETRNTNPCLREEIDNTLGTSVIANFQANGGVDLPISAFDATVSGFPITASNAAQGKYVVQVGGVTIPYKTNTGTDYELNGWSVVSSNKIRFPAYAVDQIGNMGGGEYMVERAAGRIIYTANTATAHGYITPSTSNDEPYFIINTPKDSGNVRDFDIQVTDDDGGVNLKAFKGNAKSFTDLPNQCENGFRLGVVGDNQKKEDDFHVVFTGEAGAGYWKETVAYNLQNDFDLSTMPHSLRQNADLSFKFGIGTEEDGNQWQCRKAGDDNTNPAPSFVGQKITDIFFHRNRLGVLAGENVIFSEASGYYNFWRTTVRTLLDSDPIDVAVSQNEVSELKAAVPIQDNLLLFSNLNQFTLSASQLLTPAEVTVDQSTKYECDLTTSPVGAGNSVFFATKSGGYAGVREFFTRETTEVRDAPSITSHVPSYLEGNIRQFDASANEDMLACLTSSNKKECYIYKWYNSSEERLQSSWSKWIFTENIAHVFFTNNLMYFTFEDGSYEVVDVKYDHTEVLLDRQVRVTRENYSQSSSLEIPFTGTPISGIIGGYSGLEKYTAIDESGQIHEVLYSPFTKNFIFGINPFLSGYEATADGKALIIGLPYTFKYQMSQQVFKPKQGDPTQLARFQLKKLSFNYNDTGHFDVTVDSVGRSPITSHFTGRVLDNQHNLLDQAAIIDDGSFQVGVQAQATKTAITITNDSHLPSTFQSAEWEGYVVLRNQRL